MLSVQKIGGELKDVDIEEVSFVDAPANKRKFLFTKDAKGIVQKATTHIEIVTDETQEATISINGRRVEDLLDFYFYYHKLQEGEDSYYQNGYEYNPVYASYITESDEDVGFAMTEHILTKGKEPDMKTEELIALAKKYGIDMTAESIAKMDAATIEAWGCVDRFPIPDPLAKAIGVIAKANAAPVSEELTAVVQTPTAKEIAEQVILGLATGKSEAKTEEPAPEPEKDTELTKALADRDALLKRLDKLEKGEEAEEEVPPVVEPSDELKALQESNALLTARLEVVEKSTGIVKGLEDPTKVVKSDEVDDYSSIDLGFN